MFNIKSDNKNYLAKIIELPEPFPHENANKLQKVVVFGSCVITGLDAKKGDTYIYFPLECIINKDYLSFTNSFTDKELNKDKEIRGFFHNQRVRAVRLRGAASEGYIVPFISVQAWLKSIGKKIEFTSDLIDKDFDYFDDIKICEKYVVPINNFGQGSKFNKKVKRESKIIENQYRLSEDTENLKRNINKISPDDYISIGYKIHGSNFSMGKVLCKRPLNLIEKLLKFLRVNIDDKHYDLVFASRRVIKNSYSDKKHDSFYTHDIWADIADKYKHCLKNGITLYGEIAGQMPSGSWIQNEYCYGLSEKTCDLFIYRITYTNNVGEVFEFTIPQVQRYCVNMGLKTVPIFYYGKAKDWHTKLGEKADIENHWHENFLNLLINEYNEKDCYMCKKKLPEEGIVLIKEGSFFEAYKLKSICFLERETLELDRGQVNIEDII